VLPQIQLRSPTVWAKPRPPRLVGGDRGWQLLSCIQENAQLVWSPSAHWCGDCDMVP